MVRAFGTATRCGSKLSHIWVDQEDRCKYRRSDDFLLSSFSLSPGSQPTGWCSSYSGVGLSPYLVLPGDPVTDMPRGVSPG